MSGALGWTLGKGAFLQRTNQALNRVGWLGCPVQELSLEFSSPDIAIPQLILSRAVPAFPNPLALGPGRL